jgi:signal transduction histidine kinase
VRRARPYLGRVAGVAGRVAVRLEQVQARGPTSLWGALLVSPLIVALWALALVQAANVTATASGKPPDLQAMGLVTALNTLPLLWSRLSPLAAWAPITLASAISLGSYPVWPVTCAIATLVALYTVAVRSNRATAVGATIVSTLAILPMLGNPNYAPELLPLIVLGFVAVFAFASNVRTRQFAQRALAEREEEHRQEQARRALLEERSRIARELHDVVAHHMSMIAVQAETAPYRIGGLPEEGARDFAAISATAREALTEMRRLLGVLRSENSQVELEPQPGLAQLAEMVDSARNAGLPVRLRVHGRPRALPTGIDLSAYRIAQEALTNVGRHARGANVDVEIRYEADRLEVIVTDDGRGAPAPQAGRPAGRAGTGPALPPGHAGASSGTGGALQPGGAPASSGTGPAPAPGRTGTGAGTGGAPPPGGLAGRAGTGDGDGAGRARGHGLLGMSERVAMLGGSLWAGPRPQGGFQVHATLPLQREGEL